jgi:hypothetical protein
MNPELITQVVRVNSSGLDNQKLFSDSRILATDSTNRQLLAIADLVRTNQYLIGQIIIRLQSFEDKITDKFSKIDDEFQTLKDHLANNPTDEALSQSFKNFSLSEEIQNLSKSIQEAKTLNKEALQPTFGWTREGSITLNWFDPNAPT